MSDKDLLKQIDDLVQSKTFNLDALDGIKKIKDALHETMNDLKDYKERNEFLSKSLREAHESLDAQFATVKSMNDLNAKLTDRLAAAEASVWEKKIAEATAAAYRDAFDTVFRPHTVRETVQRSVPIATTGGNNSPGYVSTFPETSTTVHETI